MNMQTMNEILTLITPHKSQCKIMVTWLMYIARPQATTPITMQQHSHVADVFYIPTCQTCLQERCAACPTAMRAGMVMRPKWYRYAEWTFPRSSPCIGP